MDFNDPALVVGGTALVAMALGMVAHRLIAAATGQVAAELTNEDPESSRIRPRPQR